MTDVMLGVLLCNDATTRSVIVVDVVVVAEVVNAAVVVALVAIVIDDVDVDASLLLEVVALRVTSIFDAVVFSMCRFLPAALLVLVAAVDDGPLAVAVVVATLVVVVVEVVATLVTVAVRGDVDDIPNTSFLCV